MRRGGEVRLPSNNDARRRSAVSRVRCMATTWSWSRTATKLRLVIGTEREVWAAA
jgi:hypothetical protein